MLPASASPYSGRTCSLRYVGNLGVWYNADKQPSTEATGSPVTCVVGVAMKVPRVIQVVFSQSLHRDFLDASSRHVFQNLDLGTRLSVESGGDQH